MANPSADPAPREPHPISIRLPRPVWFMAVIAVLIAAGAGFGAIAEHRHRVALAHLVSEGAIVGSPRYGSGVTICLAGERVTDDHLRYLRDVKGVRELGIMDAPRITDAGFAALGRRNDVEQLAIIRTGISPASIPQIGQWTALTCLWIPGLDAKGPDLIHLANLKNLVLLILDGASVADVDLQALHKLPKVLWLSLKDTQTTDAGVAELRKALPCTRVVR